MVALGYPEKDILSLLKSILKMAQCQPVQESCSPACARLGTIHILRIHLKGLKVKSVQKSPKVSKSVQKRPKVSKSVQKCQKVSKSVQKVFKKSKVIQKSLESVQKIP